MVPAIARHAGRRLEAAHVRACVDRLESIGIAAEGNVLYGDDAATALAARADEVPDAVLVVAAERWPGGNALAGDEPQAGVPVEPAGARRPRRTSTPSVISTAAPVTRSSARSARARSARSSG